MRNLLFLNKYDLYHYKITSINKFYRISDDEKIFADSCNSMKMWDNIKFKLVYAIGLHAVQFGNNWMKGSVSRNKTKYNCSDSMVHLFCHEIALFHLIHNVLTLV